MQKSRNDIARRRRSIAPTDMLKKAEVASRIDMMPIDDGVGFAYVLIEAPPEFRAKQPCPAIFTRAAARHRRRHWRNYRRVAKTMCRAINADINRREDRGNAAVARLPMRLQHHLAEAGVEPPPGRGLFFKQGGIEIDGPFHRRRRPHLRSNDMRYAALSPSWPMDDSIGTCARCLSSHDAL